MPLVRCLGCEGDYELADLTEKVPHCPLCGERHPYDAHPVDLASENTIIFRPWMAVVAGVAVLGFVVTLMLPPRGKTFTGVGEEGQPAGPFRMKAPWVLRWECEAPPTLYVYRIEEGEEEPRRVSTIGGRVPVPKIGEKELPLDGEFEVRIHPRYKGPWRLIVFD